MAMRKVFYGPDGITLKHVLLMYDKESLLNYARALEIRRISKLKKDELAEKIANELLMPSVMRRRMAVFSQKQRALLERAMKEPFVPKEDEMEDTLRLHEQDYAFLNNQMILNVPVDVKDAYEKLNTSEFQSYAKNMSWLTQCFEFCENFYGIFEKQILLEVFNCRKGYHISLEELEKLCSEFPKDMTELHIEREQKLIIPEYLVYDGEFKMLLDIQREKEFYIPNYREVLDFAEHRYLSQEPAYKKLREFFQRELKLSYREVDDAAAEVWDAFSGDEDFQDVLQYVLDEYGDFVDDRKLEKLVQLLQNANNHTRRLIHRGHTPDEMMWEAVKEGKFKENMVVVPGSTNAATLLQSASEELESMGVRVDFNGNAAVLPNTAGKKIYPNDPCPCGSGKKYKKCCGR